MKHRRSPIRLSQPNALSAGGLTVDRENRAIRGVSIVTRGPAIGHSFLVDQVMLSQVSTAINAKSKGVKVRLAHPELSGGMFGGGTDAIEVQLGRAKNARLDGDRVRGDIEFGKYASKGPKGDMPDYLMSLAEEDPEAAGLSIQFMQDEFETAADGSTLGRVADVFAVDFVGDPAANAGGLLSTKGDEQMKMTAKVRKHIEGLGMTKGLSDAEALTVET